MVQNMIKNKFKIDINLIILMLLISIISIITIHYATSILPNYMHFLALKLPTLRFFSSLPPEAIYRL